MQLELQEKLVYARTLKHNVLPKYIMKYVVPDKDFPANKGLRIHVAIDPVKTTKTKNLQLGNVVASVGLPKEGCKSTFRGFMMIASN